jgi:hypothetical protein
MLMETVVAVRRQEFKVISNVVAFMTFKHGYQSIAAYRERYIVHTID